MFTGKTLLLAVSLLLAQISFSQTLFSYGDHKVEAKSFLEAYRKNNPDTANPTEASLRQYLDLYIASRLKIQSAIDQGYDTLPSIRGEMSNLRAQILPGFLNDPAVVDSLVLQAEERSKRDIQLAHIFVSTANKSAEAARKKIDSAYSELKNGKDFGTVAKQFSEDPSVQENAGDLGYITVFALPYELENQAYSLGPGQVSSAFRSSAGFHLFKNIEERKDPGPIEIRQILLAFPPQATEAEKAAIKLQADSLYKALKAGADFSALATAYSNDIQSAVAGGKMQPFRVGTYSASFENQVLSQKAGTIAAPFETPLGYHIVERLVTTPASTDSEETRNTLRALVQSSDRMELIQQQKLDMVRNKAGVTFILQPGDELWRFTDSLTQGKASGRPNSLKKTDALLRVGKDSATIADWIEYSSIWRFKADGSGAKSYPQLMDEFVNHQASEYYKNHLEEFSPAFKQQLEEFTEGNLFFEIMQRQIWNKAQQDTAALRKWYTDNKNKYVWGKSADAVLFFCADSITAESFRAALQKDPANWKSLAASYGDRVVADSSRYERDQLPAADAELKDNTITGMRINPMDQSRNFAWILHVYTAPEVKSFEDARGFVVQDYQAALEKEWVDQLKKKYPVQINKKEWKKILAAVTN